MNISEIKSHIQLRLEDKDAKIYSTSDLATAIDGAIQKIPSILDKQYLSRLLHEQKISTGSSTASVLNSEDSYISDGQFSLADLTSNVLSGENGYELMYDQVESAYLVPNDEADFGRDITESIVWVHITDQLGRYELENSYMYNPKGDSPVFVRSGKTVSSLQEVTYTILPTNLYLFGALRILYYKKPNRVYIISDDEPEMASISHDAIIYFACSELLQSDGELERSQLMYKNGMDIIQSLNAKVGSMDQTKKQSNI